MSDDNKKIDDSLSKELQQKHDLKKTETKEKNVLPTKEDLEIEKVLNTDEEVKKQIEENPDLKEKLHHVTPQIKNLLPTAEQIEEEKKNQAQADKEQK